MAESPRALILAAGRGERMRPLTDHTPKPLLRVHGRPLIEWHLLALARAGVKTVVINTAWLGEQFEPALGDGSRFGLQLLWSHEGRDHGGALETAGAVATALPLLGDTFWVVAGDVFLPGFSFAPSDHARFASSALQAHLWLAPNAAHHPGGDFGISPEGLAVRQAPQRLTWASVGLFRASMFAALPAGQRLPLRPLLDAAMDEGQLGAQAWAGAWTDVGTIERLNALNAQAAPVW